jgi:hypothetical protein
MAKTLEQQRFQSLYEKVKRMRHNQEGFFRAKKDNPMKQALFDEARKNEQDVDGLIMIIEFEGIVEKKQQ